MSDDRERVIDRVLEVAERRFGLRTVSGPRWVRDRVGAFIDAYVERQGGSWVSVVERMTAERASMNELVSSLRVGETRFFRDAAQWEAIVHHVCALVPPSTPINALSAGCSTGEEAFTFAILLAERARRFQVLGCDRSFEAIAVARAGKYTVDALSDVPPALVERYFEHDDEGLRVRSPLRAHVGFEVRDFVVRVPRGPFHVILFKNVLLYLAEPMGTKVATRLAHELAENGLLFSAASEAVRLSAILDPRRLGPGVIAFRPRRET